MKKIFEFDSYKDFIREMVADKAQKGSQAELARVMGCQPTYLSRVLSGKPHLSVDHGLALCHWLNLDAQEVDFFLLLMTFEKAGTLQARQVLQKKISKLRSEWTRPSRLFSTDLIAKEEEHSAYYSHWYIAAIHVLAPCSTIRDSGDIAARLSLPIEVVEDSLRKLESLGYLKRAGGSWKNTRKSIHLSQGSHLVSTLHANWRHKALDNSQVNGQTSLHYSSVQSIGVKDFKVLQKTVVDCIANLRLVVKSSDQEDVVCFNCDLFFVR